MKGDRVRIKDLAEELGLSTATVSNVLHGKTGKISGETVRRVQELVERRQYVPNMAGILLAQNSSKIVGIVINDHEKYEGCVLEDPFVASALNALSRELEEAGFFMMIRVTANWNEIVRIASMWNMEGLVLIGFCEQDYRKLRESMHIPFVVYDGYFQEAERICNLVIDDYDGGYQVGTYLKRMGHRRILYLADNYDCMDRDRVEGCRAAVENTQTEGVGLEKRWKWGGAKGKEPVKEQAEQGEPEGEGVDFLRLPMARELRLNFYRDKFARIMAHTAVFAVSDFYAVEMIHFLQGQGIRVPEDISVVGFDDSPWCKMVFPALTTVKQDPARRARLAVEILQDMKRGDYSRETVKLPVWLIERDSVRNIMEAGGGQAGEDSGGAGALGGEKRKWREGIETGDKKDGTE